jgi:uncharacterized secreted repeat protein (TIGR03808 family)
MMPDRRQFLRTVAVAVPAVAAGAGPARAQGPVPAGAIDGAEAGITPDLGTDQTAQLQGAIDTAAERRRALYLPAGEMITGELTLRSGSRILGAGPATRLRRAGTDPVLAAAAAPDILVSDLAVVTDETGQGAGAGTLAAFTRCGGLELGALHALGRAGTAIALFECAGRVTGCVIDGAAIAIHSTDATGLEITANTVENCADNGILVWRSRPGEDGTIVTANRIRRIGAASAGSGENGNAINLFRAGGVIVAHNRIEDCAYSAVRANSASNAEIVNNSCTRLGEVALYAEFAFEGAVIAGNIVDDAASGISITNFNEGGRLAVCSGNLVRNLRFRDHFDRRGDGIGAEADTLITGNVVENAPGAGITLGWGAYLRNVLATGNIVRKCGVGIGVSVAPGAGPAVITGNLIADPEGAAIQGFEREKAVGGDLLAGAPDVWRHLTISGNVLG